MLPGRAARAESADPSRMRDPMTAGRPYSRLFQDVDGLPQNTIHALHGRSRGIALGRHPGRCGHLRRARLETPRPAASGPLELRAIDARGARRLALDRPPDGRAGAPARGQVARGRLRLDGARREAGQRAARDAGRRRQAGALGGNRRKRSAALRRRELDRLRNRGGSAERAGLVAAGDGRQRRATALDRHHRRAGDTAALGRPDRSARRRAEGVGQLPARRRRRRTACRRSGSEPTAAGCWSFRGGVWRRLGAAEGLSSLFVTDLAASPSGGADAFWIATDGARRRAVPGRTDPHRGARRAARLARGLQESSRRAPNRVRRRSGSAPATTA